MEHAVGSLERFLHTHYLVYCIINTQHIDIKCTRVTDDTEDGHVDTIDFVNLEALAFQIAAHLRFIFLRCSRLKYYYHKKLSPLRSDTLVI